MYAWPLGPWAGWGDVLRLAHRQEIVDDLAGDETADVAPHRIPDPQREDDRGEAVPTDPRETGEERAR